jgi:predicted transcriptional regulator of viral defense system
MQTVTEKVFENIHCGVFSAEDVANLIPGTDDKRYGLVKRAMVTGEILQIRRGLYCLAPKYLKRKIDPLILAQRIYGPSYISLELALSWHGWIPEATYSITCASMKKSNTFDTPIGRFYYTRVPQKSFYAGVERLEKDDNVIFMARPIKALADYVYVYKKDWSNLKPVIKSMRIEETDLQSIHSMEMEEIIDNYNSQRVRKFLKGLKGDLKL